MTTTGRKGKISIPQPVCEWLLEEAFMALNQKKNHTRHLLTKWQWTLCKLLFWRFLVCTPFFFQDSLRLGKLLRSVCRQVSIFCPHLLAVKVISGKFWPLCNWLYPRTANNLQLVFAKQLGNPLPVVVRGFSGRSFLILFFGAKITFLGLGNTVVWVEKWPSSAVALHI